MKGDGMTLRVKVKERLGKKFDDEIRFFKGWMSNTRAVGSIIPTSSITARRMASVVNPASGLPVLELGPGTGVITTIPLILFAAAARRLSIKVLGLLQYIAPSMVLVLGVTLFGEPLRGAQIVAFVLIWAALGLFSFSRLRMAQN